jgi:hypothetical protein
MMMPIPSPASALDSICILPDTGSPATTTWSERASETFTFAWKGDAFIGSGHAGPPAMVVYDNLYRDEFNINKYFRCSRDAEEPRPRFERGCGAR